MMISEFEQWLRSRTNQEKRPFHEEAILAYGKAARAGTATLHRGAAVTDPGPLHQGRPVPTCTVDTGHGYRAH